MTSTECKYKEDNSAKIWTWVGAAVAIISAAAAWVGIYQLSKAADFERERIAFAAEWKNDTLHIQQISGVSYHIQSISLGAEVYCPKGSPPECKTPIAQEEATSSYFQFGKPTAEYVIPNVAAIICGSAGHNCDPASIVTPILTYEIAGTKKKVTLYETENTEQPTQKIAGPCQLDDTGTPSSH